MHRRMTVYGDDLERARPDFWGFHSGILNHGANDIRRFLDMTSGVDYFVWLNATKPDVSVANLSNSIV